MATLSELVGFAASEYRAALRCYFEPLKLLVRLFSENPRCEVLVVGSQDGNHEYTSYSHLGGKIIVRDVNDGVVIQVIGKLRTGSGAKLQDIIREKAKFGCRKIFLDLTGMRALDLYRISEVVDALIFAIDHGIPLETTGLPRRVADMLAKKQRGAVVDNRGFARTDLEPVGLLIQSYFSRLPQLPLSE